MSTSENTFTYQESPFIPMRLQKYLSRAGVASRRASEKIILEKRVFVNGIVVSELGSVVVPGKDEVRVDGEVIHLPESHTYIMLYKPSGCVTTMVDTHDRFCIRDIIPIQKHPALYPVGRLDMDTTGLLLCTTDGMLGKKCLHPSQHVKKHYTVLVQGHPTEADLARLRKGIVLSDGKTLPCEVRIAALFKQSLPKTFEKIYNQKVHTLLEIVISEGKNRQIKRMCKAIGHPVLLLHRSQFGSIVLSNIKYGSWRYLTDSEITSLLNV